jgi:hypothetical protein
MLASGYRLAGGMAEWAGSGLGRQRFNTEETERTEETEEVVKGRLAVALLGWRY